MNLKASFWNLMLVAAVTTCERKQEMGGRSQSFTTFALKQDGDFSFKTHSYISAAFPSLCPLQINSSFPATPDCSPQQRWIIVSPWLDPSMIFEILYRPEEEVAAFISQANCEYMESELPRTVWLSTIVSETHPLCAAPPSSTKDNIYAQKGSTEGFPQLLWTSLGFSVQFRNSLFVQITFEFFLRGFLASPCHIIVCHLPHNYKF